MKNILIPKNFKIQEIIEKYPPTFKHNIDEFNYIIGVITYSMDSRKDAHFIPLSATILQKKIHNYKAYLTYLEEHDIINCNHTYIPGTKSKGYKLTNKYAQEGGIIVEILKPSLLKNDSQTPEYLDKWFDDLRLDEQKVSEISKETIINISTERNLERIKNKTYSLSVDSNVNRYHSNITNLNSKLRPALRYKDQHLCSIDIKNSQPYFSLKLLTKEFYDPKTKDSIYSLLDKKTIKEFKYNIPFIIDLIESSNPFDCITPEEYIIDYSKFNTSSYSTLITDTSSISSSLTLNISSSLSITSNHESIFNKTNPIAMPFTTPSHPLAYESMDAGSIYMLVNHPEKQYSSDIERFKKLVVSGELYQYIADEHYRETGVKYDLTKSSEKKIIKNAMFYTLYSKVKDYYEERGEMKRLFARLYITVFRVFNAIKRNLDKKNGYKVLAILLQRIESNIMIRGVAKELSEKYPELPIFTLHDSIVTLDTEEAKTIVSEIIKRHCSNFVGFSPKLSIEPWR